MTKETQTEGAIALACMADLLSMQRGMTAAEWKKQPLQVRLAQLRAAENDFSTKEDVQ